MSDIKTFPVLYKKTSTGAIQKWTIGVEPMEAGQGKICTEYGQIDGVMQRTYDILTEGKNVGKKNETTPLQQAIAEAQAKWEKQKKKGYVETIEAAQSEELDALIEGGIVPMLAHKFSEHGHKIRYPALVQPKLDGIRCIAIIEEGKCTLWSRTRKPITGVPHIAKELAAAFPIGKHVFDGELYNHEFKKDFEKIVSFVRQEKPAAGHEIVQYHIYDRPGESTNLERTLFLKATVGEKFQYCKLVETLHAGNEDAAIEFFHYFRNQGYEGAMIRNTDGKYANKRSYDLQKIKEFDDAEFDITGIEEGRGRLAGHVGSFKCRTVDGKEFLAKMRGDTERLKEFFVNHALWQGKRLTVQYQGLTGASGVPRFPVGVAIRDYE